MGVIYLVRHGQASFTEQNYDKLSAKGEEQAKILGKYWSELQKTNDSLLENVQYYSGSLLRHEQTAECFLSALLSENFQEPSNTNNLITHSGFNELDHVDILSCYNKNWRSFQHMCSSIKEAVNQNVNNNIEVDKESSIIAFQKEFTQAINRWTSGDYDNDYIESWQQFKSRCIASLYEVIEQTNVYQKSNKTETLTGNTKKLIIFTSGGVIGVIVGYILGVEDAKSLKISQQLINSSVTKVTFNKAGFKLNYLNNYSHLELAGQKWLSYF